MYISFYMLYSFLCHVTTLLIFNIGTHSKFKAFLCQATQTMKHLIYHFPTCYAYYIKKPIGELNLKRALDEDTGVFSFFSSSLSSPLGQTAVSGNSTLHQ